MFLCWTCQIAVESSKVSRGKNGENLDSKLNFWVSRLRLLTSWRVELPPLQSRPFKGWLTNKSRRLYHKRYHHHHHQFERTFLDAIATPISYNSPTDRQSGNVTTVSEWVSECKISSRLAGLFKQDQWTFFKFFLFCRLFNGHAPDQEIINKRMSENPFWSYSQGSKPWKKNFINLIGVCPSL